jgi:hypothetical protein
MGQGRPPLRQRSGALQIVIDPRTEKLRPEAFGALWALLAGIAAGLLIVKLLSG